MMGWGPINIVVQGDPGACRANAQELGNLGDGSHDVASGLYRVRSESESCWSGQAGDVFRDAMTKRAHGGKDLGEAASRAQKALEHFAESLDTVKARIAQACDVARQGGLVVTATEIEPPTPDPGPAPKLPPESATGGKEPVLRDFADRSKAWNQAMADHNRQVQAYQEAQDTVALARQLEDQAHNDLVSAMNFDKGLLDSLKGGLQWTVFGVDRALLTTPQSMIDKFRAKAKSSAERGTQAEAEMWEAKAARTQPMADRLESRLGWAAEDARFLGKAVKGVPVAGTVIAAGVEGYEVVHDGKPAGKAAAGLLGGTAGGMLATAAVAGLAGGPIGVLVTVGVVALASGVGSWVAEKGYDGVTESGGS